MEFITMPGMKKRNLATIDLDTGDIIEGVFATSKIKFNPWTEGFVMTALYGSKFLARDKEITGVAQRVLRELESLLDYENWIRIGLVDIARSLEIDPSQVSRAVKILVQKGIIIKGNKVGHFYTYRFNPQFCWRGDTRKQSDASQFIPSSEYTDFRRACLIKDAQEKRKKEGLEPVPNGVVVNFEKEQKKRKRIHQVAETLAQKVDINELEKLKDVDVKALKEFIRINSKK
jgi:DNA-binding Lrp family transcriptional regulator